MRKLLLLFSFLILFSCAKSDIETFDPKHYAGDWAVDASGKVYPGLEPGIYCGPGWGRKFCRFLSNYDGTIWADSENYYSDFSDIAFGFFPNMAHFISFLNLDNTVSYCEGWKLGENTFDGKRFNIEMIEDQFDVLWFRYDYFGSGEEIEYSEVYKYEVIDGLLHFTKDRDETFVFHPSEKDYSQQSLDTDEIVELEGCLFF